MGPCRPVVHVESKSADDKDVSFADVDVSELTKAIGIQLDSLLKFRFLDIEKERS
jgi:hypothetical protein